MKYTIEIASCDSEEQRPGRGDKNPKNWEAIASGNTAQEALIELIEQANNENFTIANSWLGLTISGDEGFYG